MLTKLLKYEYKTTARTLLPIGGGVLALCLLSGVLNRLLEPVPDLPVLLQWTCALLSAATAMALVFVFAACIFVNVQRFYRLLGDQGYLMLTLPVPAWQHMAAKLLCACSWTVVMFFYLVLCGDLMAGNYADILHIGGQAQEPAWWGILLLSVWMLLLVMAVAYLQFYLCCAIGAQFGQQRLLASIVTYFVMGFVEQILFVVLVMMSLFGAVWNTSLWYGLATMLEDNPELVAVWMLVGIDVILVLIGAIHWAITQWLITRRLNLA